MTQTAVRGLHQRLLRYHPPAVHFLGRYKTVSNSVVERDLVTGEQRTVLSTSDPGVVTETAMERLLEWYNATLPVHPWPVAVGCELVFRFLACHPFQDGNGRIGRALFLLALLQCDDPGLNRVARHVAIDRVIEQNRSMYYSVLAQVSGGRFRSDPREYGIEIFLGFMLQMMHRALEDVAFYRDRVETMRGLSQSAQDLLRCFRDMPEKRLSPSVLRANTDLPARTVSRLLGTLVSKGIIQRLGRGPATRYQLIF